ncbi:MAG: putative short-chain dehydrogenase [Streblomastix strix]|uniref:Putative short-chain dehydrogenase n=1 Tax=Streblomastix strix TaxID=222440 RepID=A0A5J4US91_9EUKA|nr:MAG: putative short-chain dehydrogenase [Streblomastix strix]
MLATIFIILGVIFLLSLLGYLIPQCIVKFSKPLDLKTRYNSGYAVITGGNSGIGEAFAKKVAKMGFNVIILGQNSERLQKVEAEIKQINGDITVRSIQADLSGDAEQVSNGIVQKIGDVDISILFFNAGYGVFESSASPTDNVLRQFHSNIVTHQYLFQKLYPKLANRKLSSERRGGVLFTASVAGVMQMPGASTYGATKAYLGHLGECLATEADFFGIDVVSIYPGGVNTRFGERIPQAKVSKSIQSISQSGDNVADLALSSLGRITRLDSGFQSIIVRLITKIIDANIMIFLIKKAAPSFLKTMGLDLSKGNKNKNE